MKKSTRILSLLLCLVMVFALMPTFTLEAKAVSTFYGGGKDAGSATNVTWYGKETLKDSNNNDVKIMQYIFANNGDESIDRHSFNLGSNIVMNTTTHGVRKVFLIPYGSGPLYFDKENKDANNPLKKHLERNEEDYNRWWRWESYSGSSEKWVDNTTTAGFFARAYFHTKSGLVNNNYWVGITKNSTPKFSWNSHEYTGGAVDSTGQNLEIRINATEALPVGSKGVLWSANGTRLSDRGNELPSVGTYDWIDTFYINQGAVGYNEFIIAEPKEVVYELNGGTLNGKTGNIGYICWNTNEKLTSQLHDIIGEPTRDDGYEFVGWECVSTEGTTVTGVKVTKTTIENGSSKDGVKEVSYSASAGTPIVQGKVYQPKDQNGKATTLTVLGNVVFRAKWVKATSKIAHVQNNAIKSTEDLKLSDFGSYEIVAFDKEKEFATNGEKLDITTKVPTGYLYGGTFKEDYQTVADFNGGTADSFVPKFTEKGETYYIWEVPTQHLQPTILGVFENEGGNYNVIEAYAVSAIDRLQYQEAGFIVNGNKYISKDSDVKALFEKIAVKSTKSGGSRDYTYNQLNSKFTDVKSDALLSCISFPVPAIGSTSTVVPYWITLDDQTVYGIKQAMVQYNGAGSAYKNMALTVTFDDYHGMLQSFAAPRMSASPMMLMSTFSMNMSSAPEPDEIGETVEPDEPDEPEVPDEPDVPVVPDEPEVKAMLNVVDGDKAYEVEISDDMALTAAGQDGKLFGGWFADEGCTIPANISKAQDGNTVYAKYVSDKYLQVKYNAVFTLLSKSVSLTSAVDSKDYAETGYVISTKGGDKTVVVSKYATTFALQNAKQLFGVEKNAPLMNVDYKLSGLSKNDTVTITPYWVTADGTTVYGTARTLTYTGLTMRG